MPPVCPTPGSARSPWAPCRGEVGVEIPPSWARRGSGAAAAARSARPSSRGSGRRRSSPKMPRSAPVGQPGRDTFSPARGPARTPRHTCARRRPRRRPPELVGLGRRLEHHLAADGEAEAADAVRVDVGTPLEKVDAAGRRGRRPSPTRSGPRRCGPRRGGRRAARRSRGARACGPAAGPLRPGNDDDRGAVARRDVPALELAARRWCEAHVLVGDAEAARAGTDGARRCG